VKYISEKIKAPNVTLWLGVVDPELNPFAYIVPGLGDAGDLAYGAKIDSK
jgi:uracil phosphoribosyltransferase